MLVVFLALGLGLAGCRWLAGARAPAISRGPADGRARPAAPGGAGLSLGRGAPGRPDAALQSLIERLIDEANGDTAVVVRHLVTGASAGYHERDVFPSASLAKVPILLETYRRLNAGALRPSDLVTITPESIIDGAGVLQGRAGERLPVAELLRLAVRYSDNVAARLLLQRVGGEKAVNETLAGLGLSQTRLYADERPNITTAGEMAALLASIAGRVGPGATPPANTLASLLALPQAQAWLALGLPKGTPIAHKSGQLPNLRHDAGVVYAPRGPYVLVGLTDNLADQDDAEAFLSRLSREVYVYFSR